MTERREEDRRRLAVLGSTLIIFVPLIIFFSPASRGLPLGVAPEQAIVGVVGLLLVIETLASGRLTIARSNLRVQSLFWAFCALYFGSLFVSPFPVDAGNLKASVTVFGAQAVFLGVVATILGRSWWSIRHAINAVVVLNFVLVGFGVAVLVVTQDIYFFRNGIYALETPWVEALRAYTALYNPNYYARSLLLSFPFLLVPIETSERRAYRYLCFGAAMSSVVLVILTFSRANIVVLGAVLAVVIFRYATTPRFNNPVVSVGVIGGGIVGVTAFFPLILTRFVDKIAQYTAQGTTLRLAMLQTSFESFARHPLFGTGPDTAMTVLMSDPEMREAIVTFKGRLVPLAMHNDFLLVLVEAGAVGLVLFALFLSRYWRHLLSVRSKIKEQAEDLAIAIDATELAFLVFLLSGMTAVNFGMNLVWYVLAIPLAVYRRAAFDDR